MPLPSDGAADSPIVFSSADAWAIESQRVTSKGACTTTLWNWTGAKWIAHTVGFCATGLGGTWVKDVWATGIETLPATKSRITVACWNGTTLKSVTMPHPYVYGNWSPQIVVGSISNVWVTGDNEDSANSVQPGAGWALRWNGKSWEQTSSSNLAASTGVALVGGDLWIGPDEEWSGGAWIGRTPDAALSGPVSDGGGSYDGPLIAAFGTV